MMRTPNLLILAFGTVFSQAAMARTVWTPADDSSHLSLGLSVPNWANPYGGIGTTEVRGVIGHLSGHHLAGEHVALTWDLPAFAGSYGASSQILDGAGIEDHGAYRFQTYVLGTPAVGLQFGRPGATWNLATEVRLGVFPSDIDTEAMIGVADLETYGAFSDHGSVSAEARWHAIDSGPFTLTARYSLMYFPLDLSKELFSHSALHAWYDLGFLKTGLGATAMGYIEHLNDVSLFRHVEVGGAIARDQNRFSFALTGVLSPFARRTWVRSYVGLVVTTRLGAITSPAPADEPDIYTEAPDPLFEPS